MVTSTRSNIEIFLIGKTHEIDCRTLPTKGDVLRYFYLCYKLLTFNKNNKKHTKIISCPLDTNHELLCNDKSCQPKCVVSAVRKPWLMERWSTFSLSLPPPHPPFFKFYLFL